MLRERHQHALDSCSRLVGSVGFGIRYFLHHGRPHPHSAGSGNRGGCHPPSPGSKGSAMTPTLPSGRYLMRRCLTGVLLLVLSCVPALAQADVTRAVPSARSQLRDTSLAQLAPQDGAQGAILDYTAREAAAPQLAGFAGGSGGVYIGTGALVVALLVVIIVLIVR